MLITLNAFHRQALLCSNYEKKMCTLLRLNLEEALPISEDIDDMAHIKFTHDPFTFLWAMIPQWRHFLNIRVKRGSKGPRVASFT